MKVVDGLFYSEDHEWVKVDGNKAYIGITDYAQHELGEIVFVELPEIDVELSAGDDFCVIESVKAASDSYLPISGTIVEVNTELEDNPQILNESAYDNHIVVVEMSDPSELENLMDADAYKAFCEE